MIGVGKGGATESGVSVRAGDVGVRGWKSKPGVHGTADDGTPGGMGNGYSVEYDVGGGPKYGYGYG